MQDWLDPRHISVLYNELIESIEVFDNKQNIIVDCTLWLAWHAVWIIKKLKKWDIFVWFDADAQNLDLAKEKIDSLNRDDIKIILINSNYVSLEEELEKAWINHITWIYFDLWLSSLHLDEAERWFSFRLEWPLDMRLDKTTWKTASDIIKSYSTRELFHIFKDYWEEPLSWKIANKIEDEKKDWNKFETTSDLSNAIDKVSKHAKVKTRIFQALRIEVNKELENLKISLEKAIKLLEKDGKIFVISFHSLEDRITKQLFKLESKDCICSDLICSCKHKASLKLLNKKPILPTEEEIELNQRSRSAKARLAKKI